MATNVSSTQDRAVNLLQELVTLYPTLQEPFNGSIVYAMLVAKYPLLDAIFCESAGKVVHIMAKFFADIEHQVSIRGNHAPLSWDSDPPPAVVWGASSLNQRSFTFHIPPEQRNDQIEFKLILHKGGKVFWQKGNNCHIDLSQRGHAVMYEAGMISFKETPG